MTITWTIKKVDTVEEKNGYQNVVINVHWEASIKDGVLVDQRHGSVCVALDQSKSFIPFNELTDEMYLDWVFNSAMSKNDVEVELQESINRQQNQDLKVTN